MPPTPVNISPEHVDPAPSSTPLQAEVLRLSVLLRDSETAVDRLIEHAQRAYQVHLDVGSPDVVLSVLLRNLLVDLHRGAWDAAFFSRHLTRLVLPR